MRDVLERLVEAYPKEFVYVMALADAYLETGQMKKAVRVFEEVLKKKPQHAKANLYVGMSLAKKKKYKIAIRRLGPCVILPKV